MKYLYLIVPLFLLLLSCKNKNEESPYVRKGDVIYYGNLGIDNKEAAIVFNKGLKSIEERDFYTAEEYFQKADSIENDNTVILNSLASIAEKFSNYEQAGKIYERIFSKDSLSLITYINYGNFFLSQGKYHEAKEILLKGHKKSTDASKRMKSNLLTNLSISYRELNDCENAIKYAKQAYDLAQDEVLKKATYENIHKIRKKCL